MRIKLEDTNFIDIVLQYIQSRIYTGLANFLSAFVPSKTLRHKIRKTLSSQNETFLRMRNEEYGKHYLYVPSPWSFNPNPPALYNAQGEKLRVFFARSDYYCGGGGENLL
ncbi:hypothetical protein [Helicobacter sp. MIT 05-5293]|uniref:hypothetical protein n=1 Tax=Helicobacter sp. MIT 05-5293 TaxID=1548149 RepID=UPI001315A10F|nr:hypothetical protein [Helicobacter sp. MIT 05-5293]